MNEKKVHILPVNRVEGDLQVRIEIIDGRVTDAFCQGMMYRGIENIMKGRAPLDGLVITPRICGICTTSHLLAAAKALDALYAVKAPDNAVRVRNAALMVEILQNDLRHACLLFLPDFTNSTYQDQPLYRDAMVRYAPFKGDSVTAAVRETKKILEIIAILGGQWPHSSFMVPGGVVSVINPSDIDQCRYLLSRFRQWYEIDVLGCEIEEWNAVNSHSDLLDWMAEDPARLHGDLGFFIRFCEQTGLDRLGRGVGHYISYGSFDMPENTDVKPVSAGATLWPAGVAAPDGLAPLDQHRITEDLSHARFKGDAGRHPYEGRTEPLKTASNSSRYSWGKAPRYDDRPAETGPLAEMLVAGHRLFTDLTAIYGPSVFVREMARLVRPAYLIPVLDQWLKEIATDRSEFYHPTGQPEPDGRGCGLIQAARGALGHWVTINEGIITAYQVVTPTTWNASPRDAAGARGPMEEALIGLRIEDVNNPVEIEHVIRSFDPCLVCTVHAVDLRRPGARSPLKKDPPYRAK